MTSTGHSRMQIEQPMHSPTWTGYSIVQRSGRAAGAGLDAGMVGPGHVEGLHRTDVHADAAVDAAVVVDVDAVAHGCLRCGRVPRSVRLAGRRADTCRRVGGPPI